MPVITVRIKYHKVLITYSFPFCCGLRGSGLVCLAVYRYYFCTNCTNTQCLLPALKGEGRFASWVILIGCAKTDGPITGNITGSFSIFLLSNTAWPSYRRIARSISNKMKLTKTVTTQCSTHTSYSTTVSVMQTRLQTLTSPELDQSSLRTRSRQKSVSMSLSWTWPHQVHQCQDNNSWLSKV